MATVPAIVGSARLGNFRLGYQPAALAAVRAARVRITIAGVSATARVRMASFSIRDVLNDAPNTCRFEIDGTPPTSGQAVRVTINSDTPRLLFSGAIQTNDQTYEGKPTQLVYPCLAIDDLARLNNRRPFGIWSNISATTVAQELVASFAPGFTATHVQAALPAITVAFDGTEGFSGALRQIAKLIGGYFYVEDLDLHLFTTEATDAPADLDATPNRFLNDPPIAASSDDSQLRTRVYGRGHGEVVSVDVLVGETILPLDDVVQFTATGGRAIASTTADGSPTERLQYTGVQVRQGGALVGPGVTPSVAPAAAGAAGAGLGAGVYQYAYNWVTAAGETIPSPVATVTTGDQTDPAAGPTATADLTRWSDQAALVIGDTLQFALSFSYDIANTVGIGDLVVGGSIVVPNWTGGGSHPAVIMYSGSVAATALARYAHVWISKNGAAYKHEGAFSFFTPYSAGVAFFPSGGAPPAVSRSIRQVNVSAIAIGPTGTTSRKVWRTAVDAAQLKLHTTIANNTATTIATDTLVDGSLGANAPTSDTSGLSSTDGQINPGSTSILTSGASPFSAAGGYVETSAGELVRYTGITGNTLTGVPASGAGAILTAIIYGSQILPVPALTGVTGVTKAMATGSRVHVWVQRDDVSAQADAVIRESTTGFTSDGIHEHTLIDERRGETSLTALCDADLTLFSRPIVTVTYDTRDVKTKSGKPIVVNLASPLIAETLTIQDVTITEIDRAPGTAPRFTVIASSVRFSLEDILGRLSALVPE
jgi:hypothetical protein